MALTRAEIVPADRGGPQLPECPNWQTLNARVNKNEEAESLPQYLYLLLLPESQEVRAQGAAELSPQLHRRPQPRPLLLLRAQREQSRPAAARARRAVAEVTPVGRACR